MENRGSRNFISDGRGMKLSSWPNNVPYEKW